MLLETLVFIISSLLAYVSYVHKSIHWKFDKYGVKYLPGIPLFGNSIKMFGKQHFLDILKEVYAAFPNERYFGYIEGMTPIIMIRDPELIRNVTVKDFDHFVDHKNMFPEEIEPLFGGSVFMMKGDRWRDMRATLSPAFTGSKMRMMMPFMTDSSHNVVKYLKAHQKEEVEISGLIRRFATDVIASAGYGLQTDSVNDKDNHFYNTAQQFFKFGYWQRAKFLTMAFFPSLLKALNLSMFPKETTSFFTNLITTTINFREKNNVHRPDMIQLLMEASKGELKHSQNEEKDDIGYATVEEHLKSHAKNRDWTLTELTSQVFIFFVAGYESTSAGVVFAVHELTINPEIQEKAYQEIKEFQQTDGTLTYDNIKHLKYLDCIFNETMRKWAPVILDRQCTKAYELPPAYEGGKPYPIKPGEIIYNAATPIHYDPNIWPEPQKFKPERFDDENKNKIQPFTFMPFGLGPRNCVGSRFAILEAKVVLFYILSNFKLVKCAKTSDPLVRAPSEFNQRAVGDTWVRLESRS